MDNSMHKELNFEEKKQIQLDMLKEIDAFCKANNIRYSLAFGTLLGAVRHKGFIPWDDDVDIIMPLPDLLRFKELFKSDKLKYCDVDTEKHYGYHFSRIAHKDTYNKVGLFSKSYGICIDLYVLVPVPDTEEERDAFFAEASRLQKKRLFYKKWQRRLNLLLPSIVIPGYDKVMKRFRDFFFRNTNYHSTHTWYALAGYLPLRNKMTYEMDLFEKMTQLQFEDSYYSAIAEYDYYLKLRYGNYMQLPPEKDRHPYHGGHFYFCKQNAEN